MKYLLGNFSLYTYLYLVGDGLESIHFSQDEPGVYMDLGEWEGVFRANENHWLGFKVL